MGDDMNWDLWLMSIINAWIVDHSETCNVVVVKETIDMSIYIHIFVLDGYDGASRERECYDRFVPDIMVSSTCIARGAR